MSDPTPDMEIHYQEDGWAALYVDGQLSIVGDTYLAEERALNLAGVRTVEDDAFMRGQNERSGVAQTLREVGDYAAARADRRTRAKCLRDQAAELTAAAEDLESQ